MHLAGIGWTNSARADATRVAGYCPRVNKVETGALFLSLGLFAGAIAGAYVMTVIYGEPPSERIAPSERCPPPPPCEACPPVPSCPTAVPMVELDEDDIAPIEVPNTTEAGLPGSAVALATRGFAREVESCRGGEASGTIVLDLTITASAGIGRISAINSVSAEGGGDRALPCLESAAARVQFEWTSGEGRTRLRYPLSLEQTEDPASPQ